MSGAEVKDAVTVEEAPEPPVERMRLAAPSYVEPPRVRAAPGVGVVDRALAWFERRPLPGMAAVFAFLLLVHLLVLNVAGLASGIFAGDQFFAFAGSAPIEILLLGFVAYNLALPTLIGHACLAAYEDLRPALNLDDHAYAQTRDELANSHWGWRLSFGMFWSVVLTPVFGSLLATTIAGEGVSVALLTLWMYVRIALTFGLLGASITYVAMLHRGFRAATGRHLRIDLFDLGPLAPVARYARRVALYLIVLLALAGPAVAQPEAMVASAIVLVIGVVLTAAAVVGAMWGARRAIRAAKKTALTELQTYSRELWRRAYANGRITEAVAIPALGAMLTVRAEIAKVGDWPGGWSVFARLATLAAIPILSWFGGQLAAQTMALLAR
jgi:uncharacterized membrane protein